MEHEIIYHIVCMASSILCIVLALLLLNVRSYARMVKERFPQAVPQRYMTARISLGIAYIILGGLSAVQILLEMPDETQIFIPLSGLIIASSQALLFTMAIMAFYNSKMANYRTILYNLLPFVCLLVVYFYAGGGERFRQGIRMTWLILYFIQLAVLSLVFIRARKKYLISVHCHLGHSPLCIRYEQWELVPLFIGTIVIGFYALLSFFFTERWMLSLFIVVYTIYYVAVAIYTLKYAEKGAIITDLSITDEEFQQ